MSNARRRSECSVPDGANTCAVFVLYYPSEQFAANLLGILQQVAHAIVVDNTPATAGSMLPCLSHHQVTCIVNGRNLGIATALNQGLDAALAMGFAWALTFDQDSAAKPNALRILSAITQRAYATGPVGCVGSNYCFPDSAAGRFKTRAALYDSVDEVITSGALTSVAAWRRVGRFWDELFIDAVDAELCMRLRALGYQVLLSADVLLLHQQGGAPDALSFFGRRMYSTRLTPLRRYYIARNRILVARRHHRPLPVYRFFRDDILPVLLGTNRIRKLQGVALGLVDGFRGIAGQASADRTATLS